MTRPLFEELTGDHAREDEWSGPHGFALGGMMQANTASLAEEYFAAANELADAIKDSRIENGGSRLRRGSGAGAEALAGIGSTGPPTRSGKLTLKPSVRDMATSSQIEDGAGRASEVSLKICSQAVNSSKSWFDALPARRTTSSVEDVRIV